VLLQRHQVLLDLLVVLQLHLALLDHQVQFLVLQDLQVHQAHQVLLDHLVHQAHLVLLDHPVLVLLGLQAHQELLDHQVLDLLHQACQLLLRLS
tara:strand:- start:334 stop:615 length:282 start_codon:yes stop_codon:yes gene_type:complete